ncbi:MAG: hypothetical protein WCK31_00455 [bacterium]
MQENIPSTSSIPQSTLGKSTQTKPQIDPNRKHNILIIILLVCVFVLLVIVVFLLQLEDKAENTAKLVANSTSLSTQTSSTTSKVSSITSSTLASIEFSTYSDEYISFKYPTGWSVKLNQDKYGSVIDGTDKSSCVTGDNFSGVFDIRLISPTGKEVEFGNVFGGTSTMVYQYDKSKPLVMSLIGDGDNGQESVVGTETLPSTPTIIANSFGSYFFIGERKFIDTIKKVIYIGKTDLQNNNILNIDTKPYLVIENKSNTLKFNGDVFCANGYMKFQSEPGSELGVVVHDLSVDTPANVANIVDTFITSIERKK